MKRFILFTLLLLTATIVVTGTWYLSHFKKTIPSFSPRVPDAGNALLKSKLHLSKKFAAENQYNEDFCFLVDMSQPSGSNRFFVCDLKKETITDAGLVTHGRCNRTWLNGREYGNEVGCGCTSLGKYKIGKPYQGKFGLAYKLYGLDSTNSNAFKRFVVLHSHSCVPATEVDPAPICQSDGCPTVALPFLQKLAAKLDASPKPVLLWIYE